MEAAMAEMIPTLDVAQIPGTVQISGRILARNIPYEQFMATDYGDTHVEWVNGVVIAMPSISWRHNLLTQFLTVLILAFLERRGGGQVLNDPMLMKLPSVPSSRAPDVLVLLPDRAGQLQQNQVVGPASLVIEIVSPGSVRTDYVDKRREYELGGVPEFWLIDPLKQQALFLQLNESGVYDEIEPDDGMYTSAVLVGFRLRVDVLWQDPLPSLSETVAMAAGMG
jgi:Uma2 family endonuclease